MINNATKRLFEINAQFKHNFTNLIAVGDQKYIEIIDFTPDAELKINYFKKQGWGYIGNEYKLTKFETADVMFVGDKYDFNNISLPYLAPYCLDILGED